MEYIIKYTCMLLLLFIGRGALSQTTTTVKPASNNTAVDPDICKLIPSGLDIRDEIAALALNTEYKLVKLKVLIDGANSTSNIYSTSGYHPRDWVIATSTTGKSMLMLREYFEPMSMFTLGMGVTNLDIHLKQHPENCINIMHTSQIETILRGSILNNFESDASLPETAEVCNQHVVTEGEEKAKLVFVCCKKDLNLDGAIQCGENAETIWIKMLFVSLFLIQAFIVAYFPLILPDTVFKAKTVFRSFLFKTEPDKSLVLNVKVVDSTTHVSDSFVKTRRHKFTRLTGFRNHLDQMSIGKVYSMYVNGVNISTLDSKIVADGSAPVGVVNFIYDFFIRCALRMEIDSVSPCCNAKMCKTFCPSVNFKWYQCLRIFMLLLFVGVCASPWIIRVWFYYTYEQDIIQYKKDIYNSLNITMPFSGFIVSYLSPTHPLFIAIYVLLGLEVIFYLPQTNAVKRKLKFTIRKCFRDMRDSSRVDACGYFVSKLLYPLARLGIVGCVVVPIWVVLMPFFLLLLLLEALPTANLILRLLSNLVYYTLRLISPQKFNFVGGNDNGRCSRWVNKRLEAILVTDFQEENTRCNQFIHVTSLIMTIVSFCFILFLAADCLSFFVECIVYGLIGFILSPKFILKYVSLILLIVVYGIDCFGGVKGRYVAYGQAINAKVQSMIGERMKEVASQSAKDQVNSAFRIEGNDDTEPMYLVAGSERYLKWRAPRLVLFLDSLDILYIPKSFLMRMGRLKHAICPGQVHILYLKAFVDFSVIVLFLFFVFIVIFAFGQANDISSAGQAIAALASGFIPLILRKFLFQSQSGPSVDTSNMKWHYIFLDAVDNYKDRWNLEDIQVTKVEELNHEEPKPLEEAGSDQPNIDVDIDNRSTAGIVNEEATEASTDVPDNIETDNDNHAYIIKDNAIELRMLSPDDVREINVDLIIKRVDIVEGEVDDLEFYVPITRAAECENDQLISDHDVHLTVV